MSSTFQSHGIQISDGRLCDNRGYTLTMTRYYDYMTVYFHTDGYRSGRRGLNVTFTAIGTLDDHVHSAYSTVTACSLSFTFHLSLSLSLDNSECESNNCHQCRNLRGGHECICRDGY